VVLTVSSVPILSDDFDVSFAIANLLYA